MAETGSSHAFADATSTFSPSPGPLPRVPIRRARAQLSCTPCRQGKLKCNREHPFCDQCAKRARQDACHYMPPPPKNKQAQNMRGRIRNLETLVVNLMNQRAQDQGGESQTGATQSADSTQAGSSKADRATNEGPNVDAFGQLRISNAGTENYVGAAHWSSILNEIEEVRKSLEDDDWADGTQEEEWDHLNARATVTFGVPKPISKAMLVHELHKVGKDQVDRLLPLCADPLLFIIHTPTFLEEYDQFWRDPSPTSVMWIALLFSIMALGIIVGPRNPGMINTQTSHGLNGPFFDNDDHMSHAANKFQQLASSALVLADIAKAQPYTLETLMIYGECEFLRRDDNHSKLWLMYGVLFRVAIRMGYHRDPSNFSGVTPFQGEMRRRVFHVLSMMDTLISSAIGLPSSFRSLESDVRAPRNLFDTDFSPDVAEFPRERPLTDLTPALYTIAKSRVGVVFSEAAELSHKLVPPKHSDIMALDKRLEEAHDKVPEGFRVHPMEDCITDSPVLIMGRFNVEMLYLKTRIVLHRNYLIAGQADARFKESRRLCLDAALEILKHQNTIFHACQPGGQLNKVWWYMSSLNTFDFLLAAMVLALELHHLQTEDRASRRIPELLGVLENTHGIWANYPNRYRESVRGAEILQAMIKKCSGRASSPSVGQEWAFDGLSHGTDPLVSKSSYFPDVAQEPLGLTPESMPEELPAQIWGTWHTSDVPSFDVPQIQSGIDWTLWDSTMQGRTHMLPQQNWSSPLSDNATMDEWMSMTAAVNTSLGDLHDLQDPNNMSNATGYAPPSAQMNWPLP